MRRLLGVPMRCRQVTYRRPCICLLPCSAVSGCFGLAGQIRANSGGARDCGEVYALQGGVEMCNEVERPAEETFDCPECRSTRIAAALKLTEVKVPAYMLLYYMIPWILMILAAALDLLTKRDKWDRLSLSFVILFLLAWQFVRGTRYVIRTLLRDVRYCETCGYAFVIQPGKGRLKRWISAVRKSLVNLYYRDSKRNRGAK